MFGPVCTKARHCSVTDDRMHSFDGILILRCNPCTCWRHDMLLVYVFECINTQHSFMRAAA
jgi:hypothetical protein